jgi:hypothetical protein
MNVEGMAAGKGREKIALTPAVYNVAADATSQPRISARSPKHHQTIKSQEKVTTIAEWDVGIP